jgi:hypothetical protein
MKNWTPEDNEVAQHETLTWARITTKNLKRLHSVKHSLGLRSQQRNLKRIEDNLHFCADKTFQRNANRKQRIVMKISEICENSRKRADDQNLTLCAVMASLVRVLLILQVL